MKLSDYIRLDKSYKYRLINTDIRSLGIGFIGLIIFCVFIINCALCTMDHIAVFTFYMICFTVAEALYIYPLIMVYEGGYVSIFQKYQNIPVNKRLFFRSKVILLTRFAIIFYIPVQLLHFWGLTQTTTQLLSIVGFWPLQAVLLTLLAHYIYLRILAYHFMSKK